MSKSLEPNPVTMGVALWLGHHLGGVSAGAKHRHLRRLFKQRKHGLFIESGTYKGATTALMARHAERVFTVELDSRLASEAASRFAGNDRIKVVHGDATEEIPKLVAECSSPPLIFLDGHYSGKGTAQGDEMEPSQTILGKLAHVAQPGSTIVIDDLRLFGSGLAGFPQLDEITSAARAAFPGAVIRVGLDSIVIEI